MIAKRPQAHQTLFATLSHHSQSHPFNDPASRKLLLTLHTIYPHLTLDALDLLDRGLVLKLIPASYPTHEGAAKPLAENDPRSSSLYFVKSTQPPSHPRASSSTTPISSTAPDAASPAAKTYQVHLAAWNCSCPAFAYAVFSAPASSASRQQHRRQQQLQQGPGGDQSTALQAPTGIWRAGLPGVGTERRGGVAFGGLEVEIAAASSTAEEEEEEAGEAEAAGVPCCKHMLAVALAEACPAWFARQGSATSSTMTATMSAAANDGRMKGSGMATRAVGVHEMAGWAAGGGGAF